MARKPPRGQPSRMVHIQVNKPLEVHDILRPRRQIGFQKPAPSSLNRLRTREIDEPRLRERPSSCSVHVEPQRARGSGLRLAFPRRQALFAPNRESRHIFWPPHAAIVIGDHGTPGSTLTPAQTTGMCGAERRLPVPLAENRLRPPQKAHLAQRLQSRQPAIDDTGR